MITRKTAARWIVSGAALLSFFGVAQAAPVSYTFTTAEAFLNTDPTKPSSYSAFNPTRAAFSSELAAAEALFQTLIGTSFSGTFQYDPTVPRSGTAIGGRAFSYGGSVTMLAADMVGGTLPPGTRHITDPRGGSIVGNEAQMVCPIDCLFFDFLQLSADVGNASNPTNNISGFTLGDYSVFNIRLFWYEGQRVPDPVPDLLSDNNLPGDLPSANGRLAIDFVKSNDPSGTQYIAFWDDLRVTPAQVPEPHIAALLFIAFVALTLMATRRSRDVLG